MNELASLRNRPRPREPVTLAAAIAALGLTVPVVAAPEGTVSHYNPGSGQVVIDERILQQPAKGSVGWYVLGHELFHNAQKQRGDRGYDEREADRFGKWYAPHLERQALVRSRR